MCACALTCFGMRMEFRGQLVEVGGSFPLWVPGIGTQVARPGGERLYPLSHLISSKAFFLKKTKLIYIIYDDEILLNNIMVESIVGNILETGVKRDPCPLLSYTCNGVILCTLVCAHTRDSRSTRGRGRRREGQASSTNGQGSHVENGELTSVVKPKTAK